MPISLHVEDKGRTNILKYDLLLCAFQEISKQAELIAMKATKLLTSIIAANDNTLFWLNTTSSLVSLSLLCCSPTFDRKQYEYTRDVLKGESLVRMDVHSSTTRTNLLGIKCRLSRARSLHAIDISRSISKISPKMHLC